MGGTTTNTPDPNKTTEGTSDNSNTTDNTTVDFKTLIPEEYKDKPFLQNITDLNSLLKSYENAQQLIGKKTIGIPDEKTSVEDRENFYRKLGKPENIDDYALEHTYVKIFGEEKGKNYDKKLKEVFHKNNLTSEQAKSVHIQMADLAKEIETDYVNQLQSKELEITNSIKNTIGSEIDAVSSKATAVIEKFVDKNIQDIIVKNLDEKSKLVLSSVLSKVYDNFLSSDKLPDKNMLTSLENLATIKSEITKLFSHEAYYNPQHPEYQIVRKKMEDLQYSKLKLEKNKK